MVGSKLLNLCGWERGQRRPDDGDQIQISSASPSIPIQKNIAFNILETLLEPDITLAQRSAALRSAALVCTGWKDVAQVLLSRHVNFKDTKSMERWIASGAPAKY